MPSSPKKSPKNLRPPSEDPLCPVRYHSHLRLDFKGSESTPKMTFWVQGDYPYPVGPCGDALWGQTRDEQCVHRYAKFARSADKGEDMKDLIHTCI